LENVQKLAVRRTMISSSTDCAAKSRIVQSAIVELSPLNASKACTGLLGAALPRMMNPRRTVLLPLKTSVPLGLTGLISKVAAPPPCNVMFAVEQVNCELIDHEPVQFSTSPALSLEMEVVSVFHAVVGNSPLFASFPLPEFT